MADNVSNVTCAHNSSEVSVLQILFYPGGAAFKYLKQLLKGLGRQNSEQSMNCGLMLQTNPLTPQLFLLHSIFLDWLSLSMASYLLILKHAEFWLPRPHLLA